MTVHDNRLSFQVSNSADFSAYATCSGGIGVANIKRRLQLLYPGRHQFVEKREQGMHSISLSIDLGPLSRDRLYRTNKRLTRPRIGAVPDYSL